MSHAALSLDDRPATRADAAIATPSAPAAPRLDLYAPIHKALRLALGDTLVLVGRLDVLDAGEMVSTLGHLDALLDLCTRHLEHENAFVHPAIEARQPEGSRRTADDHVEHLASIEALRAEGQALRAARPEARAGLALRLYRHLALFVAENLQHMHMEETVNNALLWAHYTDADLAEVHERLLASIPPAEHLVVARWMIPAVSPTERAGMLMGMRAGMPPPAFRGVLAHVQPHVDGRGWTKLARVLGIADDSGHATA
jgi:hypothetical protein